MYTVLSPSQSRCKFLSTFSEHFPISTRKLDVSIFALPNIMSMYFSIFQGRIYRFAEIIASFALAMEISALSAIASDQFASAHDRLGRNRPE